VGAKGHWTEQPCLRYLGGGGENNGRSKKIRPTLRVDDEKETDL